MWVMEGERERERGKKKKKAMECGLLGARNPNKVSKLMYIFSALRVYSHSPNWPSFSVALQSGGGRGKQLVPASLINYNLIIRGTYDLL